MTKRVVFKSRSTDNRVLSAADLKKAGVEDFKKITFVRNEPVEVSDEVAEVLTGHKLFTGFAIFDGEEKTEEADTGPIDTGSTQESISAPRKAGTIKSSTP